MPGDGGFSRTGSYWSQFSIDGVPQGYQPDTLSVRNGSISGVWQNHADINPPEDVCGLMLALVDYRQTPLYYNGVLADNYTLESRSPANVNVSFNLTGLTEGSHDLLLITVGNPYAVPENWTGRVFPGYIVQRAERVNVMVGNDTNDTRPVVQYDQGPLEKYVSFKNGSAANPLSYGPWMTVTPFVDMMKPDGGLPSGNAISNISVSPGENIDYYINVRNGISDEVRRDYDRLNRFTVLQLLDYEQVPIRADVPEYAYNATLDPGKMFALHASVKAPVTPGTHVLTLVVVANPYGYNNGTGPASGYAAVVPVVLNVKG